MSSRTDTTIEGDILTQEIAHLRSFGWANDQVARRLGITVEALEQRDHRMKANT